MSDCTQPRMVATRSWILMGVGALLLLGTGCYYDLPPVLDNTNDNNANSNTNANTNGDCGNGELDGSEQCDGTELDGQNCIRLGYDSGTLSCADDCSFDTTLCVQDDCGDDQIDPGEECDGLNLDGETCITQGFLGGTLACVACTFDTSSCGDCGGSTGVSCPISSISDDFTDGVQAAIWSNTYITGSASLQETNGELQIFPPDSATGYASYMTGETYDWRDDAATVRVPQTTNPAGSSETSFFILAPLPSSDNVGVTVTEGFFVFSSYVGGVWMSYVDIPYDPVAHLYWRLAESGGLLTAYTSPDGVNWTLRDSVSNPFAMDHVHLEIKAGCWESVANPGSAIFDDFNLLP